MNDSEPSATSTPPATSTPFEIKPADASKEASFASDPSTVRISPTKFTPPVTVPFRQPLSKLASEKASKLLFGETGVRTPVFPSEQIKQAKFVCHFCKIVLEEKNPVIGGTCARCATSYEDLDRAYLESWPEEKLSESANIKTANEAKTRSLSGMEATAVSATSLPNGGGMPGDWLVKATIASPTLMRPRATESFADSNNVKSAEMANSATNVIHAATSASANFPGNHVESVGMFTAQDYGNTLIASSGTGYYPAPVYVTVDLPDAVKETLEAIKKYLQKQEEFMAQAQFRPFAAPAPTPKEDPSPMENKTVAAEPKTVATEEPSRLTALKNAALDEGADAAWRMAGSQFIKLAKEPVVAALSRNLGPGDDALRGKIAAFLDTELGTAMLTALLSVGLSALPKGIGGNDLIPNLSHELRVASMSRAGDAIADVVMGPLRQVAVMYIQGNAGGATYAELERGGSAPVLKVENLAAVTSPNG